jgi:hypothetical protein
MSDSTQRTVEPAVINIIYAPGTKSLDPSKRKYFGVENVNTKERTCMINNIPQEITNAIIARLKNADPSARRFPANSQVILTQFTIETDRYNNMWYYRNSGGRKTLIWAVYSSNEGHLSFEHYKNNLTINPWDVNNKRQRDLRSLTLGRGLRPLHPRCVGCGGGVYYKYVLFLLLQ